MILKSMNQTKNTILGLAALLLVFGGIVWFTNSGSSKNGTGGGASQSAGNLVAKETSYDFGTISMTNGKVTRSFEVKNDSAEPLRITKVYTSCMCTLATLVTSAGRVACRGTAGLCFRQISKSPRARRSCSMRYLIRPRTGHRAWGWPNAMSISKQIQQSRQS